MTSVHRKAQIPQHHLVERDSTLSSCMVERSLKYFVLTAVHVTTKVLIPSLESSRAEGNKHVKCVKMLDRKSIEMERMELGSQISGMDSP